MSDNFYEIADETKELIRMSELRKNMNITDLYLLKIPEAALLFNLSEKTIRAIVASHPKGDFFLTIGNKVMIKRKKFESFLDNQLKL